MMSGGLVEPKKPRLGLGRGILIFAMISVLLQFVISIASSGVSGNPLVPLVAIAGATLAYLFWRRRQELRDFESAHQRYRHRRDELEERRQQAAKRGVKGSQIIECTYIGGSGVGFQPGDSLLMALGPAAVFLVDIYSGKETRFEFSDLLDIEVFGPGRVTTTAGVVGGGFGLMKAIEGMLTAALINELTKKTTVNSYMRIMTRGLEVVFHTSEYGIQELRMALSPAFIAAESSRRPATPPATPAPKVALPAEQTADIATSLAQLHQLHERGALSVDEFSAAKRHLLGG